MEREYTRTASWKHLTYIAKKILVELPNFRLCTYRLFPFILIWDVK